MSSLGFTYDAPVGDFTPIIKYDAKSGLITRIERVQTAAGWQNEPVNITDEFKALVDLENVEVGPINFNTGGAPSFLMVRRDDVVAGKTALPAAPDTNHKSGVRFMLKLAKGCGGERPVRELAQNSRAFLTGFDALNKQYLAEKDAHPGQLPVIALDGKPVPVKTGSGLRSSTNFHPKFKIIAWGPRGDLVYVPKTLASRMAQAENGAAGNSREKPGNGAGISGDNWDTAPATGAQRAEAPRVDTSTVAADDFG
jgi:hypothetical protein